MKKPAVLFICTGNSVRSQMAEAILRNHAGDRAEVYSAGVAPREIDPLTLRVLAENGIDTRGLHSKSIETFLGKQRVSHAIIVCEQAEINCPRLYPFALERLYWPFPSPSERATSEDERLDNFREVYDLIDTRVLAWLADTFGTNPNEGVH